jgi:hypothetical protein
LRYKTNLEGFEIDIFFEVYEDEAFEKEDA